MSQNRLSWVDYAKGIGIILVVFGHVSAGIYHAGIPYNKSFFFISNSIIYTFHMPLFFFLSGLFFFKSFDKRKGLLLLGNKIDTIFYPYILWSLLQGFLELFLSSFTNQEVTVVEILSLLWNPRSHYWFLFTLFLIFIYNIIIFSNIKKYAVYISLIISIILLILSSILNNILIIKYLTNSLIFFNIGIIFNMKMKNGISKVFILFLFFGSLILFIISQFLFHSFEFFYDTVHSIFRFPLSIIGIALVVFLTMLDKTYISKFFSFIGKYSMEIYILHIITGSGIRILLNKVLGVSNIYIHLIAGTLFGLFLPICFALILNRFKIEGLFSMPKIFSIEKLFKSISEKRNNKIYEKS